MTSRIVAVADTWSALTARGGPQLSHADALVELENAAGTRFDPRVVQAAYAVVAEERVSADEPAPGAAPAPAAPAGAAAPRHRGVLSAAHDRVDLARGPLPGERAGAIEAERAQPRALGGVAESAVSASRSASGSGSTSRAAPPQVSGSAVVSAATTGVPAAIASSTGSPKPS